MIIIWTPGEEKLEVFLTFINRVHESINFTAECSKQELAFLDTLVYKLNGRLASKVYHQKTDDKMYLHYSSAHPKSQKDAVPYSLFIRCKRVCTEDQYFFMEIQDIIQKLAHWGYPRELLINSFQKANKQNREDSQCITDTTL